MIRSLSVIILGTVLAWPVAANAQRGGGGGQRGGGGGGRGTTARTTARATVVAPNSRATTVNRAPQGGALGTPGAPGPWVGGTGAVGVAGVGGRGRQNGQFADVGYQQVYPYPVYNGGYYGIPTFTTGFDTGYYPPGVWPSPVVTPPIYPTPYYGEQPLEPQSSPQDMILAAELARISQQLADLRAQTLQPNPPDVPQPQQFQAPPNTQREKPAMPTTIIMRDGQRIETQSYAIANQTLYVFDQGTTQRFSMGSVDVDATQKENSRRGIRFLVE